MVELRSSLKEELKIFIIFYKLIVEFGFVFAQCFVACQLNKQVFLGE